jgi:hypothetical protein
MGRTAAMGKVSAAHQDIGYYYLGAIKPKDT